MKDRRSAGVIALVCLLALGCGDDDGGGGAVFSGDVDSVTPGVASIAKPEKSWLARALDDFPKRAFAQSTCPAPSGGNLLFCVETVCEVVRDCRFLLAVGLSQDPRPLDLLFIDDENEDGNADSGEDSSTVVQNFVYCDRDVVLVEDASVNFTTGTTTATVSKEVDNCGSTTRTRTPGSAGTPTRTRTPGGSTPTRTPTGYAYGASLQAEPASMFALLAGLGAIGLLVPKRPRRKARPE